MNINKWKYRIIGWCIYRQAILCMYLGIWWYFTALLFAWKLRSRQFIQCTCGFFIFYFYFLFWVLRKRVFFPPFVLCHFLLFLFFFLLLFFFVFLDIWLMILSYYFSYSSCPGHAFVLLCSRSWLQLRVSQKLCMKRLYSKAIWLLSKFDVASKNGRKMNYQSTRIYIQYPRETQWIYDDL